MLSAFLLAGCAGTQYQRSTGETIDDNATTYRVKGALGDNPVYKFPDVTVTTFKGDVQLSGFVTSQEQKAQAEHIAKHVKGVHSVSNEIELK